MSRRCRNGSSRAQAANTQLYWRCHQRGRRCTLPRHAPQNTFSCSMARAVASDSSTGLSVIMFAQILRMKSSRPSITAQRPPPEYRSLPPDRSRSARLPVCPPPLSRPRVRPHLHPSARPSSHNTATGQSGRSRRSATWPLASLATWQSGRSTIWPLWKLVTQQAGHLAIWPLRTLAARPFQPNHDRCNRAVTVPTEL